MKKIWYIGFYDGNVCSSHRRSEDNIAGTVYMKGLINSLKRLNYHVTVVSVQITSTPGIYRQEHIVYDDRLEYYFLPYISIKMKDRVVGGRTIFWALEFFLRTKVGENDIVISYHSLAYKHILSRLHKQKRFIWIPEVNEIYCLSRQKYTDPSQLKAEVEMFKDGDGYIFASDALAERYANKKPFAVLYGNYQVEIDKKYVSNESINITYTGIINEDRGVFRIIDAMTLLPANYNLYILGFGDEENMAKLEKVIRKTNNDLGCERVFFCGTKVGKEYSEFCADKHIGVSLISQEQDIFNNAFPGKILSYMSHSLYVLSSSCDSIVNSRLGEYLYFCDNNPQSIADAIKKIPVDELCNSGEVLRNLEQKFESDFMTMMLALRKEEHEN